MSRTTNLDDKIEEEDVDGFLMVEKPLKNANLYYLTQIKIPDPIVFLRLPNKSILMVSEMEKGRCDREANVDEVRTTSEYRSGDNRGDQESHFRALNSFLEEYGVKDLAVDKGEFNLGTAEKLRQEGYSIKPIENPAIHSRTIKSEEEIDKIKKVQKTTEEAMKKAEKVLRESEIRDGELWFKGEKLTSERVKTEVEKYLAEENCRNMNGMIVTGGKLSGEPHKRSSGVLKPRESIVIDIFPRHRSMYYGDMTRTFVKGEPSEEIKQMHSTVEEALEIAMNYLEEKETLIGEELNNKVCEFFESKGYGTVRNGDKTGFIHSTGHAVGLELHEAPRLGKGGGKLKPGMILTVEPGLYDPEIGGVRIEDMVLITEDGYENFNSMHRNLEID